MMDENNAEKNLYTWLKKLVFVEWVKNMKCKPIVYYFVKIPIRQLCFPRSPTIIHSILMVKSTLSINIIQ